MSEPDSNPSKNDATADAAEMASKTQHVIALALQSLPPGELADAGAVSQLWHAAAAEALSSVLVLDLKPFATRLTDEVLDDLLARAPLLRELNLSSCVRVTDAGLASVARRCPLLEDLNLACLPLVTADGVSAVTDACGSRLTSLELAGCSSISESELLRRFHRFLELDDDEDGLAKVQG